MSYTLLALLFVLLIILVVIAVKQRRQEQFIQHSLADLQLNETQQIESDLPDCVKRYFEFALIHPEFRPHQAWLLQKGKLRIDPTANRWFKFKAQQALFPKHPGFLWNAHIHMPFGMRLQVIDRFSQGQGLGRVNLFSAFQLDEQSGSPQMNAGALHRYLAEGVWCPSALLPENGVRWQALDQNSALASLQVGDTLVSLEFHFDSASGAVSKVYTPERIGKFGKEFKACAWEGHFSDYHDFGPVRVPTYGEVGWVVEDKLQIVWQGHIKKITLK